MFKVTEKKRAMISALPVSFGQGKLEILEERTLATIHFNRVYLKRNPCFQENLLRTNTSQT